MASGSHAACCWERALAACDSDRFLAAGVDAVCFGEGEQTIVELAQLASRGRPAWQDVEGIAWRRNGQTVHNPPRPPIADLDDLPFPDRTGSPIRMYRDFCSPSMRLPFVTLMASRGCPMQCSYCTAWRHWKEQVRFRTPGNVLAEIDELVQKYGVRYITMLDSVFGSEWEWLEEFCALLAERNYPLRYKVNFCPSTHRGRQEEAFRLLRSSGCDTVVIGMQAVDEATLAAIRRSTEGGAVLTECLRHARAQDLLTIVHFMSGFPYAPENEVDKIIDLLVEARPVVIDCYPLVFLPNTELREKLRSGEIDETYPYEERLKLAGEVKKRFYSSPRNVFRLLLWTARNNPGWFFRMVGHIPFGLSVIGFDLFKRRPDIEIPIQ
ncbi:MAG: B12-binding domain-containing radical SAM protein [Verrucomicrobia bacterium]|nr:B12-binding domain-containing radical SAM protein [Verrucomicrobiota bacterium]MBT7067572.1 B12-binding domain-containing radical SAM protein [Verrucomicrobiota bacterium]MBT7700140.1 B12-binding domain-containing radical SAM protein [Verrucomicrobiota bacterium]